MCAAEPEQSGDAMPWLRCIDLVERFYPLRRGDELIGLVRSQLTPADSLVYFLVEIPHGWLTLFRGNATAPLSAARP